MAHVLGLLPVSEVSFIFLNLCIYAILEGQESAVRNTSGFQANLVCVLARFSWLYTKTMTGC